MKYKIEGEFAPVVIFELEEGETLRSESGAMTWMSPNMEMSTGAGGFGKAFGRMFAGETIFQNTYTAKGGPGMIAFAGSFPGAIRVVELTPDRPVIIQKAAFLAAEPGVTQEVFFQKKIGTAIFGGEGFIMQKLSGRGLAFLEIDGHTVEYELAPGQQMVVDTGNLAMMDATCKMDVQTVKGAKNMLFGGEGLFHTVITGPGRIVVQTMPFSAFLGKVVAAVPHD